VTTVLVVDDQALIRSAVRDLLDAAPAIDVVGEAADGEVAVELTRRLSPDVVVCDIRMPRMDGIEATRQICADPALADTRVLILTT
jgi:DNA-binding NarL/FixJ family response regulator